MLKGEVRPRMPIWVYITGFLIAEQAGYRLMMLVLHRRRRQELAVLRAARRARRARVWLRVTRPVQP